jgi:hypothetical protein
MNALLPIQIRAQTVRIRSSECLLGTQGDLNSFT